LRAALRFVGNRIHNRRQRGRRQSTFGGGARPILHGGSMPGGHGIDNRARFAEGFQSADAGLDEAAQ
jgi:hypothetical protein